MGSEGEEDILALARAKMLARLRKAFGKDGAGAEEGGDDDTEKSVPSAAAFSASPASFPSPGSSPQGLDCDASLKRRAIAVVVILVAVVAASLTLLALLSIAFPKLLSPG